MQLFYAIFTENDTSIILDLNESSHLINVLRKRVGDVLLVTNGRGLLIEGQVQIAHSKSAIIGVNKVLRNENKQHPYYLHIAIAPTKNMDRIENFVEKSVEFGIDEISLLICEHSERKEIKTERLYKIALSAMKQSGSLFLPKINEAIQFNKFIDEHEQIYLCSCEGERTPINQLENTTHNYLFLVGPEGDFSSKEVQKIASKSNSIHVDLGNKRLRTETAGIFIASYIYSKYI